MFLNLNVEDSKNSNSLKMLDREFLLLMLRDAIVDKEFVVAQANKDTADRGSWSADWNIPFQIADKTVELLLVELRKK